MVATFDAESTYSTIASYSLTVDGVTKTATTGSITSAYIVNYCGTLTVTLRVTDARGYYTEVTDSIRVLDWFKPYIDRVGSNDGIVCERRKVETAEDVTVDYDHLYIAAKRVYAPMAGENVLEGSAFTQGNLCTLRYCIKKTSDPDYSYEFVNLLSSGSLTTDEYVGLVLKADGSPVQLEKSESYEVYLQIYDATNTGTPTYATIPTDKAALHLGEGGNKAAFGKYAERENALEIAWNIFDQYDTEITNGVALYDSAVATDPDTTMDSLIMTKVNTPVSGIYYYIHTIFREHKSEEAKRTQFAIPYQSNNPVAFRFYNNGWSDWNKCTRLSDLSAVSEKVDNMGKYYTKSATVTIENNTWTALVGVTVPAGIYVFTAFARFTGNTAGVRTLNLSTTSGDAGTMVRDVPSTSGVTQMNLTLVIPVASERTIYLNAHQTSGSALTCDSAGTFIRAVRIADYTG